MPVISSDNILPYKVAYSCDITTNFNSIRIKESICNNIKELLELHSIRDWLLPMLMN